MSATSSLAAWRKLRGYTQERLAQAAGVTWSTIASIEGNHHEPSLTLATRIAELLEAPLGEVAWPLRATLAPYPSQREGYTAHKRTP